MINFSISGSLSEAIKSQLQKYEGDKVARTVATSLMPELRYRIHQLGLATDLSPIGVYNSNYLRLRQKKYNRTADPKIISSLTRQQENDWAVVPIGENAYGIGFKNIANAIKAEHLEKNKKKQIFALSEKEIALIPQIVDTL